MTMFRRLALSLLIAFGLVTFNVSLPAIGSTSSEPAGRVLINAPEPVASDLTPPPFLRSAVAPPGFGALPAGIVAKRSAPVINSGQSNHVSKLGPQDVQNIERQGMKVLDNREGEWQIQAKVNGESRLFVVVDAVLPSGREVVGFGTTPMPSQPAVSLIRALDVSAGSVGFFICSYAWMTSYYADLHVHLCTVDAAAIAAILTIVGAAVGGLVGAIMGGAVGAVVGIAIGTALGLLTIIFFWTHSDSQGNVDFVIPSWTMQPPFGGQMLWANIGRWDYMWDQCWINDSGSWYAPRCSY
jgi:hypothetical protein